MSYTLANWYQIDYKSSTDMYAEVYQIIAHPTASSVYQAHLLYGIMHSPTPGMF
jgi:hypothetical protein